MTDKKLSKESIIPKEKIDEALQRGKEEGLERLRKKVKKQTEKPINEKLDLEVVKGIKMRLNEETGQVK